MTAVLDPFKPVSAELHIIRQPNSSLYRAASGDELEPFGRFYTPSQHVALAPSRRDVPLLDQCCGQLSAGAEVDLGIKGRQKFIDFHHVASALWVPPGFSERPQTALSADLIENKAWNSRRTPNAVLRASLSGSPNPTKVQLLSLRTPRKASLHSYSLPDRQTEPQDGSPPHLGQWTDSTPAVRHFRYTSATQRSYEEVGWDAKLPRRLRAPRTTLEKQAHPLSECLSPRRYSSRPQLWQCIGAEWSRQQLRSRNDARKPISFCSVCSRSGQIPLYTGMIGSENMDNIDNMEKDFHQLTLKRSTIPPYTATACRATIPGYTGKAAYANSVAADAAVCSPAHASGAAEESGSPVVTCGALVPDGDHHNPQQPVPETCTSCLIHIHKGRY